MVLALAALSACGGDDDGGDGAAQTGSTGGGPVTSGAGGGPPSDPGSRPNVISTPKGEAYAEGEPRRGGSAVYALEGTFQRIDPTSATSNGLTQLWVSIFGNLLRLNDTGDAIEPGMALSIESDDDRVWTMKLRPGLKFTDGTPYDGAAVVAHITRLKDPASKYARANILAPVVSITAPDAETVVWELDAPFPAFPSTLVTEGISYVPSPTALATLGDTFGVKPVGAGPFMVKEIQPDAKAVLVRNPDYWDPEKPYLDEITFIPLSDSEAKLAALQTGDIDAAFTLSDQDWARAEQAGIKVLRQRSVTYQTPLLNIERAPFDDVRVRRALAMAIDNDAINEVVYGGVREVVRTVLPSGHPYHDPEARIPEYDPDEAKRLIDEYVAEKGAPVEFDISVNIQPEFQQVWTIILQMWSQVGVTANMSVMDQAEHVAQANAGNYDAQGRYGLILSWPDVSAYNQLHTDGGVNVANISDPVIDEALETLRASTDEDVRREQMNIVQRRMADQSYFLWHTLQSQGFYIGPKIKGFPGAHGASPGYFYSEDLWV